MSFQNIAPVLTLIITGAYAYLGNHVTLHPPQTHLEKIRYRWKFILLSVAAFAIGVYQSIRADKSVQELTKQLKESQKSNAENAKSNADLKDTVMALRQELAGQPLKPSAKLASSQPAEMSTESSYDSHAHERRLTLIRLGERLTKLGSSLAILLVEYKEKSKELRDSAQMHMICQRIIETRDQLRAEGIEYPELNDTVAKIENDLTVEDLKQMRVVLDEIGQNVGTRGRAIRYE